MTDNSFLLSGKVKMHAKTDRKSCPKPSTRASDEKLISTTTPLHIEQFTLRTKTTKRNFIFADTPLQHTHKISKAVSAYSHTHNQDSTFNFRSQTSGDTHQIRKKKPLFQPQTLRQISQRPPKALPGINSLQSKKQKPNLSNKSQELKKIFETENNRKNHKQNGQFTKKSGVTNNELRNATQPAKGSKIHQRGISTSLLQRKPILFENSQQGHRVNNGSVKFKGKQLTPIQQFDKEDREKMYRLIRSQFQSLVNTTNDIEICNSRSTFRAYIEKGNNGAIVKQLLKKRWWWSIEQKDPRKANLVWTEWFNNGVVEPMDELSNNYVSEKLIPYKNKQESEISGEATSSRVASIKKLTDNSTFGQIQPRISSGYVNYFKSSRKFLSYKPKHEPTNQSQQALPITFRPRLLLKKESSDKKQYQVSNETIIHNHVSGCLNLHSKKLLFKNFYSFLTERQWDPFQFIPLTFYVEKTDCESYSSLMKQYDRFAEIEKESKNLWIVKPGENSNRGFGIKVVQKREELVEQIEQRVRRNEEMGYKRSVIVQKYIEKCFLINKRKFDIRCYILLTTVNGQLKGYWYRDGYIRTSSEEYTLEDTSNLMVHLTNDAIQKKNTSYGRYEDFNKITFAGFRSYLKRNGHKQLDFDSAYEQMKLNAYYLIASVASKIKHKQFTFELFGLDFMLDQKLHPLLIQANSNPCLDTSGVILTKIIHELVQNVIMTAIDPLFPEPTDIKKGKQFLYKDYFASNQFELIFSD